VTLSVIIPVRNERATILAVIERVRAVDVGMAKQIIVIDGASTDGTRELLQDARGEDLTVIFEDAARGKGMAVRTGLEHATGDVVVIQDADLELDPGIFPALLAPITGGLADAAFGVRFAHGRGATPRASYLGNRALSLCAGLLFRRPMNDILTAYKMVRADVARSLPLTCRGFDLDAELACRLVQRGHRLIEVPVEYIPRGRGEGKKLGFSAGWSVLKAILRVRLERRRPVPDGVATTPAQLPPDDRSV
jgi:glycosyltransferase involved in cell wall biosynthesis